MAPCGWAFPLKIIYFLQKIKLKKLQNERFLAFNDNCVYSVVGGFYFYLKSSKLNAVSVYIKDIIFAPMSYFDIIILIPALWFGYKGFTHGFIRELASLAALLIGIYAAFMFTDLVEEWINNPNIPKEVYFAITFLLVLIGVFVLGKLVEKIVKLIIPEFVNHLLGSLFGAAKVLVFFSAIFYFIHSIDSKNSILKKETTEKSFTYKYIEPIVPKLKTWYEKK
ncbi:MAG: CvpA family protein [Lentimicrobiaceae bacterium]|nr:CvpA family protein [Lentimicrobiaceae bacterium]